LTDPPRSLRLGEEHLLATDRRSRYFPGESRPSQVLASSDWALHEFEAFALGRERGLKSISGPDPQDVLLGHRDLGLEFNSRQHRASAIKLAEWSSGDVFFAGTAPGGWSVLEAATATRGPEGVGERPMALHPVLTGGGGKM